jgi:predicted  nucleic acid-binding Zn-ribbon protein
MDSLLKEMLASMQNEITEIRRMHERILKENESMRDESESVKKDLASVRKDLEAARVKHTLDVEALREVSHPSFQSSS